MIASLWTRLTAALGETPGLLAGDHQVCRDLKGRGIVLHDLTIRNILTRIDPLVTISEGGQVSMPAYEIADVLGNRYGSIYRRTPNQIAAAPITDEIPVARLRAFVAARLAEDERATITFDVPGPIAGWIRLRYERAERMIEDLSRVA